MMRLSNPSRERLKRLEGFRAKAYIPVPGDKITIGYGFTHGVKMGDVMTRDEADARLIEELRPYETVVWQGCTNEPNQNEFDAMTSLCYNIGPGGFKRSTVLKAHNRGDHQAAARAFGLWVNAGGKQWPGLVRRRAAEAALYLEPIPDDVSDPMDGPIEEMPQAVEPERSMMKSEINRASLAAGGTTALAAVAETVNTVNSVKYGVEGLGAWLVPLLLVFVVGLIGYIVYMRFSQRSSGWA